MSKEYIGSLSIVLVSILQLFGVELGTETISAIVTGIVAIYVAVARYRKGDITVGGLKK